MKSNKKQEVVITLGLVVLFIFLAFYINMTQNKAKKAMFSLQTEYQNVRFEMQDVREAIHYRLISEEVKLPEELCTVLPTDTCILRIHNIACLGCYAENLIRFSEKMKTEGLPFFVLGTYPNAKQFVSELSDIISLDSINSFNMQNYGFLPIDSINRPYLFFKTENGKTQNMYVFEKGKYQILNEYIELIKRQYGDIYRKY